MMIEYIRYSLGSHRPEEFAQAWQKAFAWLRASPQCLGYEVTQCADDAPADHIVRLLWTSREGHLEGFRKGPNFRPFLETIRPFIGEITEMRHYEMVAPDWVRS